MKSPQHYKTQSGLLKALWRAHYMQIDVSLAIWFQNCIHTLIDDFGWDKAQAKKYVSGYFPHESKYIGTGKG